MDSRKSTKILGLTMALSLLLPGLAQAEGSRYDLERAYNAEISAAKAYLEMNAGNGIVIDVRRLREYAAGHPYAADNPDDLTHAFNVPYPHIIGSGDQNPAVFFSEVEYIIAEIGGDTETKIMTLCRTGFRSVLAGNILADPATYICDEGDTACQDSYNGRGFSNVYNIWEGFVGRFKEADVSPLNTEPYEVESLHGVGQTNLTGPGKRGVVHSLFEQKNELLTHEALHHNYLDLNNNEEMDSDTADVIVETRDANADKDGWRNFQGLPTSTIVEDDFAYMQDPDGYGPYTPVTP
jgi:rhodanese-related sulfurtransferase